MPFQVETPLFQGSVQEFWEKTRNSEVEITRVSLYPLFASFLDYLQKNESPDLDREIEELRLLTALLLLKLELVLPFSLPSGEEEEEVWDEEEEERWRWMMEELRAREEKELEYFLAGFLEEEREEEGEILIDPEELMRVFTKVLRNLSRKDVMRLQKEEFTVKDKITFIMELLRKKSRLKFSSLFLKARDRVEMVVIFLALLELVRRNLVKVYQKQPFGEIWVRSKQPLPG